MSDQPDFSWLVVQRSEAQRLLLKLYQFGTEEPERLADELTRSVYHLLVGAAFSLWRAVFLIEPETSTQETVDHSVQFLELLVRDNTINYTQDRNTRAWTAGYYLNGAFFRLTEAIARLESCREIGAGVTDAFTAFGHADRCQLVSTDRRKACRIAFEAAEGALSQLKHVECTTRNIDA
jgi:hypothetical protein